MGLFDELDLHRPRTPKGTFSYSPIKGDRPTEKALIVYFQGRGKIIEHGGFNIELHLSDCGHDLDEITNETPPSDGLWVFEGRQHGSGPDYNGEYDSWWTGKIRPLNEEEVVEWKEVGHLDDLWWDDHLKLEAEWPCSHCGKPKGEHTVKYDEGEEFKLFYPVSCFACPTETS